MEQRWRPVVGFEGYYEVSDAGDIKRVKGGPGVRAGRILRANRNPNGYLTVMLRRDGEKCTRTIHKLVASAFLGPCPEGLEVNHKDGNKQNPALRNLEYVTHKENVAHAFRTGLRFKAVPPHHHGVKNPAAKLTDAQVREIFTSGESNVALGARFGVSDVAVSLIRRRKKWCQLTNGLTPAVARPGPGRSVIRQTAELRGI